MGGRADQTSVIIIIIIIIIIITTTTTTTTIRCDVAPARGGARARPRRPGSAQQRLGG